MKRRIQETFDMIHADAELKEKTKAFLAEKTENYRETSPKRKGLLLPRARLVPALCLLLAVLGLGGCRYYFTPVSVISIDINPSLELDVNRFDRIVSVKGYNEDGEKLAESMKLMFLNYTDALEQLMENENIQSYLSQDAWMSIVVTGDDDTKTQTVYNKVEECTADQENTHCYHADSQEVEAAHEAGLSYGKYMAYLELQALDPDITPDQVQGMTMREIRDWIEELSGGSAETDTGQTENCDLNETCAGSGNGSQGTGNGNHGEESGREYSGQHHGEGYGHGRGSGRNHEE